MSTALRHRSRRGAAGRLLEAEGPGPGIENFEGVGGVVRNRGHGSLLGRDSSDATPLVQGCPMRGDVHVTRPAPARPHRQIPPWPFAGSANYCSS
jgi:hypothetical protein